LDTSRPHLRRVLGRADLTFFLIAALVNLNSVPVVAGIGPAAILFWVVAFLLFFIPQGIAVLELSRRLPEEGGIYRWSKTAFGPFHGFLSGWCYWTNNIFYVPTLLFYIVGFTAFIGGRWTAWISHDPLMMAGISLALLWGITWLNVLGFGVGKWVQTIGASGTFLTTLLILGVAAVAVRQNGMANAITLATLLPPEADWRMLSLLSVVCLNYVGLELASVVVEEVKDPDRDLPRAALIAGLSAVVLFVTATFALQATIPAAEIGVIDGILQGVERAARSVGVAWIVVPVAVLMSLNAAGNTSAWLAGSSRIPFVIGLDRFLPRTFGRIHPRHQTPHIALGVQAFASSLFIVINAVGASVRDMYLILLQTTIILQLVPYLYMFAACLRIPRDPSRYGAREGFFRHRGLTTAAGIVGFAMTGLGLAFAFVPSGTVDDPTGFELKLLLGIGSFILPALLIYRRSAGRTLVTISGTVEVAQE
jgi:amino acid transporter